MAHATLVQPAHRAACAGLFCTILTASAAPVLTEGPRPYGRLFRSLAGDTLEKDHGIGVVGFAHVTAAFAHNDIATTRLAQGRGRNVQPQGGLVQDEGVNLNQLGLIVCKGAGCPPFRLFQPNRNVLSRITPLPGPRGNHVIVDWAVSAVYGEDAVFWKTKGMDDWKWDADDRERLAITQWFLDIYLPVGAGASVIVGSWHSPLAHEIGYPFNPPNWFSSRTYAFAVGPAKHVGALSQFKLPLEPALGHASVGFGVVTDWNAIDFGSGGHDPNFLFEARWRSPDMQTWIDLEVIHGNGEDDFGDVTVRNGTAFPRGGGTQFLAVSSTSEYLSRTFGYLTFMHHFNDSVSAVLETVYGFQEGGDLAPLPFAVTQDSAMFGANLGVRYRLTEHLHTAIRAEWLRDENAANFLWGAVGARGGDVYALTANVAWEVIPHLLVRPELKYDVYAGDGHLFAVGANGLAREDDQLLGVLNLEFRF
ncbi:MAG: outer membrane beta-barrel protein [Gammaproteobacteria bacterium]